MGKSIIGDKCEKPYVNFTCDFFGNFYKKNYINISQIVYNMLICDTVYKHFCLMF